ncbi:MAG: metal-sensitive transcriptional regulator [Dehalococcoidia bacterium]
MVADSKANALRRLATIEGHLAAVRRMIERDDYCVDVLKQTYAVRRAIERLESNLLSAHLQTCLPAGIREGRDDQVIDELIQLYALNNK